MRIGRRPAEPDPVVRIVEPHGFDFSDAAAGASIAMSTLLFVASGLLLVRRRQHLASA